MRYLVAAVLSALLLGWANTATPVNKLESKAVVTATTKAATPLRSEQPEAPAKQEETPAPTPPVETPATQPEPATETAPVQRTPVPTTNEELMAAAGISPADYGAVDYIVSKESGWNTTAVNPSSGSCGLVQELPCGKSGCAFGDGVCQLRWATNYAVSRYGSWWSAQGFWSLNRWW